MKSYLVDVWFEPVVTQVMCDCYKHLLTDLYDDYDLLYLCKSGFEYLVPSYPSHITAAEYDRWSPSEK